MTQSSSPSDTGPATPPDEAAQLSSASQVTEFGNTKPGHINPVGLAAVLGVLGVVYGDIGTSPIYALRTTVLMVAGHHQVAPWEILGVESLIFWALIMVVTVKYVFLVMRADYNGEGGILALVTSALRGVTHPKVRAGLALAGIIGTCLFFGDGMITPAISVLSAIEGLEVSFPAAGELVIPISILILICLFSVQWRGTGKVGPVFGVIMLLWFASIGLLGLAEVIRHPAILQALVPHHAVIFAWYHGWLSFLALGCVVLAVTGAEALYADMGHFGRAPIRYVWLFFVLPALVLNYLGQGALIIADPKALANPFFMLGPHWVRIPMLVLSTCATVIASQAGISGGFSLARQLIQLGYLPRLKIKHTNADEEGQIYLPQVNVAIMTGSLILVLAFRNSEALASAYGIAVTGTFLCTCILASVTFYRVYKWPLAVVLPVFGFFFMMDSLFFLANALKIPQGGWVPLLLGGVLTIMMTTWRKGRSIILARQKQEGLPLASFMARLPKSHTIRVPGMAVFMTASSDNVPSCLLHNLKHNKVLHEQVLFVTIQNLDQPFADPGHQIALQMLAPGIYRVIIRYGFMETPRLTAALQKLNKKGIKFDPLQASYFVNRELVVRSSVPKMSAWRTRLFQLMARNATPATEFFRIPLDRVVELGVKISV